MSDASFTGQLTSADIALGMPPGDPIFTGPPYYWQDVERLVLTYQTDLDACLRLCPDFMEVDPSATARLILYNFPFCTLGPYHEASLQFKVTFEGEPYWYEFKNIVDSDIAFTAGREVLGIPKKMGWLNWTKTPENGIGIEVGRGSNIPILTAAFIPTKPRTPGADLPSISLRVIPTGIGGAPEVTLYNSQDPETAEFIIGDGGYVFEGQGSLAFHSQSAMDPWHEFRVIKMLDADYIGGSNSFSVGFGKILKKF